MSNWRQRIWLVTGLLFILLLGKELLSLSKTDEVIGEVHHQRHRQEIVGGRIFVNPVISRLITNKYLVANEKITQKVLEVVDPNVIFFAGHPNERAGIDEKERINWLFVPFFVWGVITIIGSNKTKFKHIVVITLIVSIMWAIKFEKINDEALVGIMIWVWGVIGIGIYNLARKFL